MSQAVKSRPHFARFVVGECNIHPDSHICDIELHIRSCTLASFFVCGQLDGLERWSPRKLDHVAACDIIFQARCMHGQTASRLLLIAMLPGKKLTQSKTKSCK